ncbi:MAG: signal peptidase I [SAR202 cluster bacterium]|nr:signal peptidase I [Chloroflexota bacterium]MQG51442.1 signal peptidase I [SAR202 cluster bacterium]
MLNIYKYIQYKILKVDGQSMSPCLNTNDIVLGKYSLKLFRNNLICFNLPSNTNKLYIKRIIGLPYEFIEFTDSHIIINGEKLISHNIDIKKLSASKWYNDANQLFVLGDNSLDSYDSKNFGPININWIKYKIIAKLWPLGKLNAH